MADAAWDSAKKLAWRLRDHGCTAPWNDILIAALSVKADCRIYAVDKHFDLMHDAGAGIRLYQPGYGGKYNPAEFQFDFSAIAAHSIHAPHPTGTGTD